MRDSAFALILKFYRRLGVKRFLPQGLSNYLRGAVLNTVVRGLPDRLFLEQKILPSLHTLARGRVLFIGCEAYTRDYGAPFRSSEIEFWTTEIKPENAGWGEPGRHIVCDALTLESKFARDSFDVVILSGVFGFGIDSTQAKNQCLNSVRAVLRSTGILVLGWNRSLMEDPSSLEALKQNFERGSLLPLPNRQEFEKVSHVFDVFSVLKHE